MRAAEDPRLLDSGYIGGRTDTTQQSGQTPDKEMGINHITAYVSGYTETDRPESYLPTTADCLAPTKWVCFDPTVWPDTCCSVHRIRVLLQRTKRI